MKDKLCCIFNTPSLYREAIYTCIENEYDCEWHFEKTDNKLKEFDTSKFKKVVFHDSSFWGPVYSVKGLLKLLWRNDMSDFLMMGHSRNMTTYLMLILKKIFFRKKRIYLWTHGLYGKESFIERHLKLLLFKLANQNFVYGDYASNLMREAGISDSKIHPIHNSLDYNSQLKLRNSNLKSDIYTSHFHNNNPVLIFIGRLTPVKRLDMIIGVIEKLKKQGLFFNVVFVGDGSERESLQKMVFNNKLEDQIWFYGACYDEVRNAELIYNADLCVAPGNIGLTSIHALMFGCPAISHDDFAHQMPEFEVIKEGISGCFFKKDNIDSLMKSIENWFLKNGDNRVQIRTNCYEIIDKEWNPHYQMSILKNVIH